MGSVMQQSSLWHDSIFDALGASVQAAGGVKKVASQLWPALDTSSATARLRAGMNPDHAQKLCLLEMQMILRLALDAGDTSVLEYLAKDLGCELKVLTPAEAKKRAKRMRRLDLLEQLKRLEDEE
jgi:hypothetical protein